MISSSSSWEFSLVPPFGGLNGSRIGEAAHPGPMDWLTIGTTNPGGLRGKEQLAVDQGSGIWTYAETQLSKVTQVSASKALKYHASQTGRYLRVHHGAPAPLRARSTWAGSWTGVTCTSDFCSKSLQVEWPHEFWTSGRVLATQHFVGKHRITVVSIYGLPRGPTWPQAAALTNELLSFVSREFVIGMSGIVAIMGDFNFGPRELPCFDLWRAYGFQLAQDLAFERWSRPVAATCKGKTERDMIWLSPMASLLCANIETQDVFHDHSSLRVQLNIEVLSGSVQTWPRPSQIPWDQVRIPEWHASCDEVQIPDHLDSTKQLMEISSSFEHSLDGYVSDQPGDKLSAAHCGRAQRLRPAKTAPSPSSCRASRPGEERLIADSVSKAVILWFKQLRRLQSYQHAIQAGNIHQAAVHYRIELWSAIRRARGFEHSFPDWWLSQDFAWSLGALPITPPDAPLATLIYQAFHHAFRDFERWHLNQRQKILQAKYDKTMKAVFQDLRKARPDQVDSFWTTSSFEIRAMRPQNSSFLLDKPVPDAPMGQWFFNGSPLEVKGMVEELLILESPPLLAVGDVLEFHTHTSSISEVHESLISFWTPKWQPEGHLSDDVWRRISGFVQALIPKLSLTLPPLTLDDWLGSVRRFRPTAARGADGWAKLDLLHLPRAHTLKLLALLTAVENNEVEWPAQLLEGLVIAISKCDGAHQPNEFRPIVLLPIIYRCWASLRSRQLLLMLEPYIHADAHGFLPSREPAQTWLQVQAAVESALQARQSLAGIGTDVIKAFNCIQREPLWTLAEAIGVPHNLLHPWRTYVARFTRRFVVCNQVSSAQLSTQGFAEGCPLSVLAMALVDWGYQLYQQHYVPQVRHFSFVDNISMLSREVERVVWAFFTLRAFLSMWGLSLDLSKTYAWGTTAVTRQRLAQAGFRVVEDFSELGGALSFTASHRVRLFLKRGESLQEKWMQLRRSRAPISLKLSALPIVFWARALHGTLSCVQADHHIQKLRTNAVKYTGSQLAGSNAMLRLSLSAPMTADPGFYQLKRAIFDFRRLCLKCPDLLMYWRCFMARFDGTVLDGPFSKLISLLNSVGWTILDPPLVQDHDGFTFDLFQLPRGGLDSLLQDAWFQHIATRTNHKSMRDLCGLDVALTLLDHNKQTAIDVARIRALQSGAFVSSWQHAKYDTTKQPVCQFCLQPDTQMHWLKCPRFAAQRTDCGDLLSWIDRAPSCLAHHLLAPRSPFVLPLKRYFMDLPDLSNCFHSTPRTGETNHVFTDGSFFKGIVPNLDRAAWAVINASTQQAISYGVVPGLFQSIGRAELWAVISAIEWAVMHSATLIIWTDSASTCSRAQALQHEGMPFFFGGENHDLWSRLAAALSQTSIDQVTFRWIPSHVDTSLCTTTEEEFLATWNDIVDAQAVATNLQRGPMFAQLLADAEAYYSTWQTRLRSLRSFYLQVAQTKHDQIDVIDLTAEASVELQGVDDTPLGDALPVDWKQQLTRSSDALTMPTEFVSFLVSSLVSIEPVQNNFVVISFIELTLWCVQELKAQFPIKQATKGQWRFQTVDSMLLKPTLASLTSKLKKSFLFALKTLGLESYICRGCVRHEAGIAIPVDGLLLSMPPESANQMSTASSTFFGPRMLRKSADLARPVA
eukprot:s90_g48.t1